MNEIPELEVTLDGIVQMNEIPLAYAMPWLGDGLCSWQNCDQRSTHRCSVRYGQAEVHFGLSVCDSCAPEITLDDIVPASVWDDFVLLLRAAGERWPVRGNCRVHLTPLTERP